MKNINTQGLLLGNLIYLDAPLSTMQVAELSGMAWKTARNNLEKLFEVGLVCKGRVGNNKRIFWKNAKQS